MKIAKTPQFHLAATYGGNTFAKPGETQDKAIKRFMAGRRRTWVSAGPREFPKWTEKMTTRAYVAAYLKNNRLIDAGHSDNVSATVPAQYTGPEVEVFTEAANDAFTLELIAA